MPRKILIAIELDELSAMAVLSRAVALCSEEDHVEVLHVIDPSSIAYAVDPTFKGEFRRDFEANAVAKAQEQLSRLVSQHDLPSAEEACPKCHVRIGRIARDIHDFIEQESFDCLMIGSHGWHGWQRLLGTHASRILDQSPVNTWVFKVPAGISN
jgi:universal stress protein A